MSYSARLLIKLFFCRQTSADGLPPSAATNFYGFRALCRRFPAIWARAGRKIALPLSLLLAAVAVRIGLNKLVVLTGPVASKTDLGSEAVGLAAGAWLFIQGVSAGTLALSQR